MAELTNEEVEIRKKSELKKQLGEQSIQYKITSHINNNNNTFSTAGKYINKLSFSQYDRSYSHPT